MDDIRSGNGQGNSARSEAPVRALFDAGHEPDNGTYQVSRDVLEQIWAERAAQFAEAPATEDAVERADLLIVRLGDEFYGLEANYVFRIRPAMQIAPVPRVPAWVAGLANERGRILSVLDIKAFLGLSAKQEREEHTQPSLIIVETPEMELALLVDEVLELQTIQINRVQKAADTTRSIPAEYVHGVVTDLDDLYLQEGEHATLVVLDLRALLADESLIVHEEII
jgi:purine-binding chemotaxis protein CheW